MTEYGLKKSFKFIKKHNVQENNVSKKFSNFILRTLSVQSLHYTESQSFEL